MSSIYYDIGPILVYKSLSVPNSVPVRPNLPFKLILFPVPLKEYTPQKAAGILTDPSVSLPIPNNFIHEFLYNIFHQYEYNQNFKKHDF